MIGYGIAWHEGQPLGRANQMLGLLTAAGILTIAATGLLCGASGARRQPPKSEAGRRAGNAPC